MPWTVLQVSVGRDPGVEQAAGFKRCFETGAGVIGHGVVELDQLPQRRTGAVHAAGGIAPCRGQWCDLFPRLQALALLVEPVACLGQGACGLVQGGLLCAQRLQGPQVRVLQTTARWGQRQGFTHPVGQRCQGHRALVWRKLEGLQPVQVVVPGLGQVLRLLLDRLVGLGGPFDRLVRLGLAVVTAALVFLLLPLRLSKGLVVLHQPRDGFTAVGHALAQLLAHHVECRCVQRGQRVIVEDEQRVPGVFGFQTQPWCLTEGLAARLVTVLAQVVQLPGQPLGLGGLLGDAVFEGVQSALGVLRGPLAGLGFTLGGGQPVGVLHGRIGPQGVQPRPAGMHRQLGLLDGGTCGRFLLPGRLQVLAGFGAGAAGLVEFGLRLPQQPGLASAEGRGVLAVTALELAHGTLQRLVSLQFQAVLLQPLQRFGHVAKQVGRQWRQGLGQRVRQRPLVRLSGQLGLAQLDQRVHQRAVAVGAQAEQALVDGEPVRLRGLEHLTATVDGLAQLVACGHLPAGVHQPEVLTDAGGGALAHRFEQEKPALDLRAAFHGLQPGAQRHVMQRAVGVAAAELDPGVAGAARVGAQQQVPRHLLARIAIGFDARGLELGVQQEGQHQRQHLGLASAVVAPQQQVAVPEPELLAVVAEQLDQPEPQRLPACALRCGQRRSGGG